jgi:hypothetical protein
MKAVFLILAAIAAVFMVPNIYFAAHNHTGNGVAAIISGLGVVTALYMASSGNRGKRKRDGK